ncbi:MAG: SGNH/GDSL hydrolase family protein [Clostridia bacterium]|nr:SGNH/GDSL hydrolase family protein [Clostridia bacterium]
MSNIANIDKNFKIDTKIDKTDIKFYDVRNAPFGVHGVFYEEGKFRRMPMEVARAVSPGVYSLHANTAGGRVRFRTNSSYVAINVKMANVGKMSHFALCGSSGFDLYVDGEYFRSFIPPFDITDGYEGVHEIGTDTPKMREIMINMPLYSDVCEMYVGLEENAEILAETPYRVEKPVVFYGSSITQGGCASRPGTSYQGFLSRWLDFDFINLGFSGNARAEDEMADYIASLDMSVFVYDYDHNSPDAEHLKRTHERMFKKIRAAHPTLPVIFISMPKPYLAPFQLERLEIIKTTYENAVANGDKNVCFIDGRTLLTLAGAEGSVDFTHPTDLGFFSMAKRIAEDLNNFL